MSSGSYFLEDRSQPLVNPNPTTLNEYFQTEHIDVRDDDNSIWASMIRTMASVTGGILKPRQSLVILRILKAVSLCFIVLNILANLMYILFVELLAGKEVRAIAGGWRDVIMRIFSVPILLLALAIEVDYTKIVKKYYGLKSFLSRAILYLFIAMVIASTPDVRLLAVSEEENAEAANDDAQNDDANANDDANVYDESTASPEVPTSAVFFQTVASFILGACGLLYLLCGLLCLDRFTARAFLSDKDPRITTAIAPSSPRMNREKGAYNKSEIPLDVEKQMSSDDLGEFD